MDVVASLRGRAAGLRALAGRLDASPVHALRAAGGAATWAGPVATAFDVDLGHHQFAVLEAAEELRWEAWLLEGRADALAAELAATAARAAAEAE